MDELNKQNKRIFHYFTYEIIKIPNDRLKLFEFYLNMPIIVFSASQFKEYPFPMQFDMASANPINIDVKEIMADLKKK